MWIDIAKSLKINITTAFRHLKRLGIKKNVQFWQIENVHFFLPRKRKSACYKTDIFGMLKELEWEIFSRQQKKI